MSYKILKNLKQETGKPIKRIISDFLIDKIFPTNVRRKNNGTKS